MTKLISNHIDLAMKRLFYQYDDSKSIRGILESLAEQIQDVENNQFALYYVWHIELSFGQQLDNIGEQVGLARGGLNDADYRVRLRTKIAVNTSAGLTEQIYSFIRLLAGNRDGYLKLTDNYPAGFQIEITINFSDNELQFLKEAIQQVKPMAVTFTGMTKADEDSFRFDIGKGFGSIHNPSSGGKFAGLI